MDKRSTHSSNTGIKHCKIKPLSSYPTKFPTFTTFSFKNFSNQVNFHSQEKLICKNSWYRDLKSNFKRNRHLLDLPYKTPKCCSDIYNVVEDRQKLKKLEKYGLTRSVRTSVSELELEEASKCDPEENKKKFKEKGTDMRREKGVCFPSPAVSVNDFSDDDDDDDDGNYLLCSSGSLSECSGCSTLGGRRRTKRHKVEKKNWKDLLHAPGEELCKESVASEIKKHKLGYNLTLKLRKIF